jgi:hypothetical protein
LNPVNLIEKDLQQENNALSQIMLDKDSPEFTQHKIYRVLGSTGQFDFPSLPHGSNGFYAANGSEALRLTRASKEIQTVLSREWLQLPKTNPVQLASLILLFFDEGIKARHRVLASADELQALCTPPKGYQLNSIAYEEALPQIGVTEFLSTEPVILLRAVTLLGWMHEKQNLGIEVLEIQQSGTVTLRERQVLAEPIFKSVPSLRY